MKRVLKAIARFLIGYRFKGTFALANAFPAKINSDTVTRKADVVISTKHLLVKQGTDENHIDICGASDRPMGVASDEATAIEDPVAVGLFGAAVWTRFVVASEATASGVELYTAANGKVQTEPSASGTYYRVGCSVCSASGDGELLEMDPYPPTMFIVP